MQHVFGTIGLPGSGKSTFGEVAQSIDRQVSMISIGDIVRELADDRGHETSEEISKFADRMRDEHGRGVFAEKLPEVVDTSSDVLVVDGIRSPEEIEKLNELADCKITVVYISTPKEVRYDRLTSRGREDEGSMTYSEFKERDERELSWGVEEILENELYDIEIVNDGSLRQFRQEIEQVLEENIQFELGEPQ